MSGGHRLAELDGDCAAALAAARALFSSFSRILTQ